MDDDWEYTNESILRRSVLYVVIGGMSGGDL